MAPFMKKQRYCRSFEGVTYFKPRSMPLRGLEINVLALDELEAIHLCDYEDLDQAAAAEKMKIGTSTLQRLLYSGRKKIIDALYTSKAIQISKPNQILEYKELGRQCRQRGGRGRRRGCHNREEDNV